MRGNSVPHRYSAGSAPRAWAAGSWGSRSSTPQYGERGVAAPTLYGGPMSLGCGGLQPLGFSRKLPRIRPSRLGIQQSSISPSNVSSEGAPQWKKQCEVTNGRMEIYTNAQMLRGQLGAPNARFQNHPVNFEECAIEIATIWQKKVLACIETGA